MKEWATTAIGIAFSVTIIVYFGMGKIPLEVFGPIATAAILWFFREKALTNIVKSLLKK